MEDFFEKAFDAFLEKHEYDAAEDALFYLARSAFYAGWQAAGGAPVVRRPALTVISSAGRECTKKNK